MAAGARAGAGRYAVIDQVMIAACGLTSVYCSQDRREGVRRWACIAGLVGEPFWLWAAVKAEQWGVVALCFVFMFGWSRGFYLHWIKKSPQQ